jgi:hypothetical protein
MFGLEALDVLIGLVAVYLAFGVACTAVVEAFSAWFSVRAGNLETALKELFKGDLDPNTPFVKAFYRHPLVQSLSKGDNCPSYIAPEIVGQVVQSLVVAKGAGKALKDAVDTLPDTPEVNRVKGLLAALAERAGNDVKAFREEVEKQFNDAMVRAAGWFKRYTQVVALIASALIVTLGNVDTIDIVRSLASSPEDRARMIDTLAQRLTQAEEAKRERATSLDKDALAQATEGSKKVRDAYERAVDDVGTAGIQLGWKNLPEERSVGWYLSKMIGLLVSIFAVSLGAPFWFDLLQRFMQVRAAGQSPRRAKEQGTV